MSIHEFSIRHHVAVMVLILVIILTGTYAYMVMPRESFPEITIPNVIVSATYEGVAPSDIETLITMHIEKKLASISGVKEIRSYSSEGAASIICEFETDVEIESALQKVRDKVDEAKSDLPDDLDEPSVDEINFSEFPIMTVIISGPVGLVRLKEIADDFQDDFESIPGILQAPITGGLEREIRVTFEPERLAAYGLAVADLLQAVRTNNKNTPGGDMDIGVGNYLVKIPGEFKSPAEAKRLIVHTKDQKPVYITDVAEIRDGYEEAKTMARLNQSEAITVNIIKRSGVNLIEISDRVKEIIAEAQPSMPDGVNVSVVMDQSKDIKSMVSDLENSILSGLILVLLVVFFAMGFRNAAIVASSIPFSMLISFVIVKFSGLTLNMMVLFSMVLAVGMLVDNAIVIVENIYRHRQEGKTKLDAAITGTGEVITPVVASTMTTVAAFSPMVFWPGMVGEFMSFLPVTVIIALVSSLFVAMVINPTLAALFIKVSKHKQNPKPNFFMRRYGNVVQGAVAYPFFTVCFAVMFMVFIFALYGKFGSGVEFFPEVEPPRSFVDIAMPEGTNVNETDKLMKQIEEYASVYPDIRSLVTNVGTTGGTGEQMMTGEQVSPNIARMMMEFKDSRDRDIQPTKIMEELREKTHPMYQAEIKIVKEENGPPTGAPVSIELSGEHYSVLSELMHQVKEAIKTVPGLVNLKDDYVVARPEIEVKVNKERAALLGLSTSAVAAVIEAAVRGLEAGVYREGNDEYDIIVQLPIERRKNLDALMNLRVINTSGEYVPLSSVADVSLSAGLGTIIRVDQKRVITITADAEGRLANDVLNDVKGILSSMVLPSGYKVAFRGEDEEQAEAQTFLTEAFLGALLLIALILVTEFNSIYKPLIVLSSVILSTMGVFIGLLILDKPFGIIMTGIGVISLAGVVVNNAIVLIDYIGQLRERGLSNEESIVQAGMVRLRPVLLTAISTILGLMPMAVGISFDFRALEWQQGTESMQWWGPMATAVIFGLSIATILTLVVVPAMVALGDKFSENVKWFIGLFASPSKEDELLEIKPFEKISNN